MCLARNSYYPLLQIEYPSKYFDYDCFLYIIFGKVCCASLLGRVGVIKIVIVINCNIITFLKVIACNCN